VDDGECMHRAIALADSVRGTTAPNPWVGCVVVSALDPSQTFEGATAPPGGRHAEITALARAGERHARGATTGVPLPAPTPSWRPGWRGWSSG